MFPCHITQQTYWRNTQPASPLSGGALWDQSDVPLRVLGTVLWETSQRQRTGGPWALRNTGNITTCGSTPTLSRTLLVCWLSTGYHDIKFQFFKKGFDFPGCIDMGINGLWLEPAPSMWSWSQSILSEKCLASDVGNYGKPTPLPNSKQHFEKCGPGPLGNSDQAWASVESGVQRAVLGYCMARFQRTSKCRTLVHFTQII